MTEPTLAERLGGRWAISVAGHGVGVVSAAIVVGNLVRREGGGLHLGAAGLALLITVTYTATVDMMLHRTAFARRAVTPVPLWWVGVKHAASGLMLAFSVWWVSNGLVAGLDQPAPSMWVTLPALSIWGGSAVTVTLDLRWRSARSRAALLDEAGRLGVVALQQQAVADEIVRTHAIGVTESFRRLRSDVDDVTSTVASGADDDELASVRRLAGDLRSTSQGVVRDTSSRLWDRAEHALPRVTWRMQLTNTLHTQPFRPLVVLTVGVMPRMLWEVGDLGLVRGGLLTLAGSVFLLVVCATANRAMRRYQPWHSAIFVSTVIVLQFGTAVSVALKNSWVPGYVTGVDLVVQVITGVALIFFSSGWATFWNLAQRRDQLFVQRLTPARQHAVARSAALAHAARSLAQDLHGGAQARLFACAMALEEAVDADDVAALNKALAMTREVLEQPLSLPRVDQDIDAAVAAAAQAWAGLCEVLVHRDAAVVDGFDPVTVRHVVDEALVNAVRHGGAGKVELSLSLTADDHLRIEVRDDGAAESLDLRRGLGSAMFDRLAPGRWGRRPDHGGTVLWLELAHLPQRTTS